MIFSEDQHEDFQDSKNPILKRCLEIDKRLDALTDEDLELPEAQLDLQRLKCVRTIFELLGISE